MEKFSRAHSMLWNEKEQKKANLDDVQLVFVEFGDKQYTFYGNLVKSESYPYSGAS